MSSVPLGTDPKARRHDATVLAGTVAVLLVVTAASVFFGSAGLTPSDVLHGLRVMVESGGSSSPAAQIVLLRLLRIGLGVLVGASLGLSGFLLQTAFRNPLADSYLLGVSGGAQLAVTLVALLGVSGSVGIIPVMVAAPLVGALGVLILLLIISRRIGHDLLAFLLSGLALSYMLNAMYSILVSTRPDVLSNTVFWSWMGLNRASGSGMIVVGVGLAIAIPLVMSLMRPLRSYLVGDDFAMNVGVNVKRTRITLLFISVILAATDVAASGVVGFAGLFSPHLARLLTRRTDRSFIVLTMLMGAIVVVVGDLIARSVSASEIPLNTVLSLFGAPYLIWLSVKARRAL
ncbi:MAG: FecCD family ABC transporter permease [Candidatus Cryosericum sp.]